MDNFCGGAFWNTTLLLENTWPQLTPCFVDLVVTCAPCLMFWLAIPCHVYKEESNRVARPFSYPASRLNVAKLVCCCLLCVLVVLKLLEHVFTATSPATIVGDSVLLLTLVAATLMTQYERSRCVITSSPLFVFWLLKTGCDVIPLYTKVMLKDYEMDVGQFAEFVLGYLLTLTMVLLYAFADPVAVSFTNKLHPAGERACPETTTSFLNQLTFAWLTKLMVLAYQRGVEMADMWDLNPRDQSVNLIRVFERIWGQEQQRCSRINKKQPNVHYGNGHLPKHSHSSNDLIDERTPILGNGHPTTNHTLTQQNGTPNSAFGRKRSMTRSSGSEETLFQSYETEREDVSFHQEEGPKMTQNMQIGNTRPSLVRVLFRQFGGTMAVCLVQRLMSDAFLILNPLILGQLISHLNTRQEGREWQGYVLAVALLLFGTCRTVFHALAIYRAYYVGLQIKSVVIGAVFNKALRINNEAKKRATSGEIVSLMSVDAQRLQEFISRIFFGISIPLVLISVIAIVYSYVADAAFAGVVVLVVLIPLTGLAGACQKLVQEKLLLFKDLRIKTFNEILNGIKVLKLYAWEESFERRVAEVRGQEVRCLMRVAMLYVLLGLCFNMMAFLMTLATYGWYVLSHSDHFLDPSAAFVIMSLLNVLTPTLDSLGMLISFFVQAKVSVRRINDFLCSPELDFDAVSHVTNPGEAIRVEKATFSWDDTQYPILKNISVTVPTGRLVAVVGPVGAGKSSLISSFLGEMVTLQGHVALKGSVAYVAQQAWIQNATVRDNVLFGQAYQRERYNAVVKACQLERDLSILPAGDMTEIGEKGTNLSGGQKQRVSLARAVYSDSDVYLMDDPLSAVDSHVGKAIFRDVVGPRGILKGKTRVLVTHGVHWLPLVDEIVVLRQGQITEVGSYTQLMRHNGDFAQFLKTYFTEDHNNDGEGEGDEDEEDEELTDPEVVEMRRQILADVESATTDAATSGDDMQIRIRDFLPRRKRRKDRDRRHQAERHKGKDRQSAYDEVNPVMEDRGKLILSETMAKGRMPFHVYLHYPRAAGLVSLLVAALCFASFRAASVGANFWLRQWTGDPVLTNQSTWGSEVFVNTNKYYLTVYGIFGVLQVVLLLAYNALYWVRTIQASTRLHDRMIRKLFRAPMAFFDTTPIGRIMNRVSTDMEIVDNLMPIIFRDLVSTFTVLLATVIVLVVVSPTSIVVLLPLAVFCYFSLASYVPMSRQCRRMEAVTRSPIFAHFSETITGAATIRAYRATQRFVQESKTRVDDNQKFYFAWMAGLRWIQMSLDGVTNVVIFMAALLEIVSPNPSGGAAGLSVSYALQLTYTLNYLVRQVTDFETNVVSVERLKEYSEVPSEASWVNEQKRPAPDWPARGGVELRGFQTRYRPGLELVLKGVSCQIKGGEKIGIVGRTGAGKSSLSLALFRLIEATGGAILVDGINIADMGLHDLRARLTILPQDPVLFSGSLRFNLDPFGQYDDVALWRALQQAYLHEFVQGLPGDLSYECGEEGLNLSVGQRQLVCLARTLLRKTRILVLDEATAAVDMETDALIQATVRHAFSTCTILTIAHRLNTIMDYDRILVMDSGTVREFDTPANLLTKPNSVFAAMLRDAGLA